MVNYIIGVEGYAYDPYTDTIEISIDNAYNMDDLNDSELIEYMSDSITHEFIHSVLHKAFNKVVSELFDTISDSIRNMDLALKTLKGSGYLTHVLYIKKYGFNEWMHFYGLTKNIIHDSIRKCTPIIQKGNTWIEVFGMHYLYRFEDENHSKVLRFNGSLFVQFDYLEEL